MAKRVAVWLFLVASVVVQAELTSGSEIRGPLSPDSNGKALSKSKKSGKNSSSSKESNTSSSKHTIDDDEHIKEKELSASSTSTSGTSLPSLSEKLELPFDDDTFFDGYETDRELSVPPSPSESEIVLDDDDDTPSMIDTDDLPSSEELEFPLDDDIYDDESANEKELPGTSTENDESIEYGNEDDTSVKPIMKSDTTDEGAISRLKNMGVTPSHIQTDKETTEDEANNEYTNERESSGSSPPQPTQSHSTDDDISSPKPSEKIQPSSPQSSSSSTVSPSSSSSSSEKSSKEKGVGCNNQERNLDNNHDENSDCDNELLSNEFKENEKPKNDSQRNYMHIQHFYGPYVHQSSVSGEQINVEPHGHKLGHVSSFSAWGVGLGYSQNNATNESDDEYDEKESKDKVGDANRALQKTAAARPVPSMRGSTGNK